MAKPIVPVVGRLKKGWELLEKDPSLMAQWPEARRRVVERACDVLGLPGSHVEAVLSTEEPEEEPTDGHDCWYCMHVLDVYCEVASMWLFDSYEKLFGKMLHVARPAMDSDKSGHGRHERPLACRLALERVLHSGQWDTGHPALVQRLVTNRNPKVGVWVFGSARPLPLDPPTDDSPLEKLRILDAWRVVLGGRDYGRGLPHHNRFDPVRSILLQTPKDLEASARIEAHAALDRALDALDHSPPTPPANCPYNLRIRLCRYGAYCKWAAGKDVPTPDGYAEYLLQPENEKKLKRLIEKRTFVRSEEQRKKDIREAVRLCKPNPAVSPLDTYLATAQVH